VTRPKWKLDSVRLEIVLILKLDRWTVCVEDTRGLEIVLYAPDATMALFNWLIIRTF
jgi:hypothetical protein